MPDTAVWGRFAVGVEVFDANLHTTLPSNPPARPAGSAASTPPPTSSPTSTTVHGGLRVQLRLPGGRLLDPVAATGPELGPQRQFLFNVRAEDFPPGALPMVAVSSPDSPSFVDRQIGRATGVQESAPLTVRAVRGRHPMLCGRASARAPPPWANPRNS